MKKLIYQLTITTLVLILSTSLSGQDEKPAAFWNKSNTTDFRTIQSETEGWFEGKDKGQGTGYKQWKRWEDFNAVRLTPDGQLTNHSARSNEALNQIKKGQPKHFNRSTIDTWARWGNNNYTNGTYNGGALTVLPGTGVINCIAFHPTDGSILFVGGPATGLWKTTDHGVTWMNLTDESLINVGVSSIAINRVNPNIMYIMTGDGDGEDTYSMGIWKTVDGGNFWFPTSLHWNVQDMKRGFKLEIDPFDPDIIYAATSEGLYRTSDGFNWSQVQSGYFYDVVLRPLGQVYVYASTKDQVYRSTNVGLNWDIVLTIINSERIQIAVSPQNHELLYAIGGGYFNWGFVNGFPGFFVSENSGTSWDAKSIAPAICSYNTGSTPFGEQIPYDLDIAVSPTDPSKVFTGAINLYGSTDTAQTWTALAMWQSGVSTNNYVHADIHGLEYNSINNRLYCVSDGGVYFSTNDGLTFTDLSQGLNINQFYDFAGTPQNSNYMVGGLYHNGSREFFGTNNALQVSGGDGTGCMIDFANINTIYTSSQFGQLYRSTDGGQSYINVAPISNGPFVSNFAMNPLNSNIIFAGWTNDIVYFSNNRGNTWLSDNLPGAGCGYYCNVRQISPASDGLTFYACTGDAVFKSTSAGGSWAHLFSFNFDPYYTSVKPHPTIPEIAIITAGGYNAGEKVYYVNGSSVTNISYDLPNVPVHCSVIHATGTGLDDFYVGTDIGVFKKSIIGTSWTLFDNGMPNTIVKDLEIYQNRSILRAATFGRGLWETDITCIEYLVLDEANDPNFGSPVFQHNQAGTGIYSTRKVTGSNGDVTYKAGNFVILDSGFLATEGNKVIVGTAPCGVEINE
jgi:photosystem II stability/assembly factor-like uncharacterized protein